MQSANQIAVPPPFERGRISILQNKFQSTSLLHDSFKAFPLNTQIPTSLNHNCGIPFFLPMEVIAASSSVAALLTIALQSAKVIHDTVVAIRNGPSQIRNLATAVDDLHRMHKQLAEISVEEVSSAGRSEDTGGLKASIKKCALDLLAAQGKISKLQAVPQDSNLGRTWKQAKLILAKDDIIQLWSTVNHHIVALSLQLNIENMSVTSCYFPCIQPDKEVLI
jgi:hypothetical protein